MVAKLRTPDPRAWLPRPAFEMAVVGPQAVNALPQLGIRLHLADRHVLHPPLFHEPSLHNDPGVLADGHECRDDVISPVARSAEGTSTRDHILAAAERQFAQRGFAGVAMREIASEAGLRNQASLYHHFRNKRALYEAVLANGLEPIMTLIVESSQAAVRGNAGPATQRRVLDAVLDHLLDYLAEHANLPRLLQRAGLDDSRYLRSAAATLLLRFYSEGLNVLAETGSPWQVADLPHVAVGIYHLIFGYFADAALIEPLLQADPRSPQVVARQRRFVKAAVAQLLGLPAEPLPMRAKPLLAEA